MVLAMRGYDDPCGIARALGVVGERWALLVVRELVFGPKRFTDLRRGLTGISENVLSQRLRELEQAAIVRRRRFAPSSTSAYELTPLGRSLGPVLTALRHWGTQIPDGSTNPDLSTDALVFALQSTFDTEIAAGLDAEVQLDLDDDRFLIDVRPGRFRVARGEAADADVTITTNTRTLQSLVSADRTLADASAAGEVSVAGDQDIAEHLLRCFPQT
jgi:DNA-binding HxlR family transcriptional regulator